MTGKNGGSTPTYSISGWWLSTSYISSMGLPLRDLSTRDGFWGSPSGKIHLDLHLKGGWFQILRVSPLRCGYGSKMVNQNEMVEQMIKICDGKTPNLTGTTHWLTAKETAYFKVDWLKNLKICQNTSGAANYCGCGLVIPYLNPSVPNCDCRTKSDFQTFEKPLGWMQWNSVCVPEVQNRTQKWQAHGVMELMGTNWFHPTGRWSLVTCGHQYHGTHEIPWPLNIFVTSYFQLFMSLSN